MFRVMPSWLIGCLGVAFGIAFPAPAGAQEAAQQRLEQSPRHQEWVTIPAEGGRQLRAFVVYPEREVERQSPAVIVIHENRGLTDWVRSVADELAEAGYVAIAPDLLSGTGPDKGGTASFASQDEARRALYELKPEQVTADLDATFEYAQNLEAVSDQVAVAGFCWGGGQAFRYAAHNPNLAAAYVFYGPAPDEQAVDQIQAPVYGFYGGNDARITAQVPRVSEQMKEAGKKYEPVVYEGAGHGFFRAGQEPGASEANKKARAEAWERWQKLLGALAG